MMIRRVLGLISGLIFAGIHGAAQDNRGVMLNAESASAPREINIGLPDSGNGATVYVDGIKHAQGLLRSQYHWAGGNAYEPVRTISLMEAVIIGGDFGILVDSRTRLGGDVHHGAFSGSTSSNGLIRFDGAVNGPIRGKWHYAAGAYVNYDPTGVHSPSRLFVDQKQIYQVALTRRTDNTEFTAAYRLSLCNDRIDGAYSVAPFIYNGDGSISALNGFRLGTDCYMPSDETIRWMDVVYGDFRTGDMSKMDRRITHDFHLGYSVNTSSGWDLSAIFHLCYMQPSQFMKVSLAGIDQVSSAQGYSTVSGSFEGNLQHRLATVYYSWSLDPDLLFKAVKTIGKHKIEGGLDFQYTHMYEAGSSFQFAHTVQPSPERVLKDGLDCWSFNRNSSYFDATRTFAALYVFDNWRPTERLLVKSGLRFKPFIKNVDSAARLEGETINTRVEGFNLANPTMAKLHKFDDPGIDYAASEHIMCRIYGNLYAFAEGFYSMTNKGITYFKNATIPSLKPIGIALARGGLSFNNKHFDATLLGFYITTWNKAAALTVTKQIAGTSETIPWYAEYGIGTSGVTFDGNCHFGGFNLHVNATWQNPVYKDYKNKFTFSDGSVTSIDYTGNTVTGISRFMLEVDPSYTWKGYRVWASARYYSRQYVSRTNLAYFAGHVETFAGASASFGKWGSLNLNLVNVLFQRGAKGSIDIADTIEDAAALQGLVMAGSYIRPFEVELGYTYKF